MGHGLQGANPNQLPASGVAGGEPTVRLSHAQALQDLSGGQAGPEGHLAVVLPRRQDRRGRPERRRQVDAAQDHGRPGRGLRRRGLGLARHQGRLPAAGAGARCQQGRARQRHGGRGGEKGPRRPLQRDRRQLLGRDCRRDGQAAGRDRGGQPVGPRHPGRAGARRPALSARRSRGHETVGRREAPRRAHQAAAGQARHPAAGRADQPPRRRSRSPGWSAISRNTRAA